jgi:hypothetical protein
MAWSNQRFSVRDFLRDTEALLVHFSTPNTLHPDLFFPDDLKQAARLREKVLSFSTILRTDVGPYQRGVHPEDANAQGSVGIVVDIPTDDCVIAVAPGDYGVHFDLTAESKVLSGAASDAVECARSIDERRSSNDWWVTNYRMLGIFIFEPALAFRLLTDVVIEVQVPMEKVLSDFPDERIFSIRNGRFVEYNRNFDAWIPSTYSKIVPQHLEAERPADSGGAAPSKPNGEVLH